MISVNSPGDVLVDWADWTLPLQQFSQASGLVVSAYDAHGNRKLGPLYASRTAALLASSNLWQEGGPGALLERAMVTRLADGGAAGAELFCEALRVCSMPLTQSGQTYGVLVYGWAFRDFSSPLACERIGRLIGVLGHVLWSAVRLEAPVADARMAVLSALLGTVVESIDRQRETIAELNRVSRVRELFLATVSHEMRTPLSALSLRLELMLRTVPELPPAVRTGLLSMRKHVAQETGMINDLIDASRTLTGQMSIARQGVALAQVLRDAVSTVEVHAHEKRVALLVSPSDYGEGIVIEADGQRLQQVVWNLLLNAIKFTPASGKVALTVRRSDGQVEIDVSDSGQGIAEPDLAHVFGAFNLQKQGNESGLGLGLYIARHIVELHGGAISVRSAGAGCGTTFSIRLPLGNQQPR